MKLTLNKDENGSALLWVMSTVLVLSIAGAAVLSNSNTRYNVTTQQVKGWQDALGAAEAGADLGFAQVRLYGLDSSKGFATADGWASPAPSPLPATNSWNRGYTTAPAIFGEDNTLSAKVTVDRFASLPSVGASPPGYYRIRSVGTAQVRGLNQTGMNDGLESGGTNFGGGEKARGKGDSLLRKIDFKFDHFLATYGYGDALPSAPATSANGKSAVPIANSGFAQVTRRVELIAIPIMPIEAAIKTGTFRGTTVDSYDSKNPPVSGTNPPSSYYGNAANSAYAADARNGDVACATSNFYVQTMVYGDVSTNGGNATKDKVTGVVDNNVPFSLPPAVPGTAPIPNLPGPNPESQTSGDINPPNRDEQISGVSTGRKQTVFWYNYTSLGGIKISPNKADAVPGGGQEPIDTTINIYVNGNIDTSTSFTNLVVEKGVTANIYFTGNLTAKVASIDNQNGDGPGGNGVYVRDYTDLGPGMSPRYVDTGTFSPSSFVSRAGHLWFHGISPPAGQSRTIALAPGLGGGVGGAWAAFYAPGHDCHTNGNPELYGVMVSKSFYQNGGNMFHFDKQLLTAGNPLDYRVASYIEDIR